MGQPQKPTEIKKKKNLQGAKLVLYFTPKSLKYK